MQSVLCVICWCVYLRGDALTGAVVQQELHHHHVVLLRRHVQRREAILEGAQTRSGVCSPRINLGHVSPCVTL